MDEQQTPLPPGTPAPDFYLPRSAHASVSPGDFVGRRLVLAFYPADWEPVSREQLALYEQYTPEFEALRARVVGIFSPDGVWCHAAFTREVGLRFPLLSDSQPKGAVARAYGVGLEDRVESSRALFVVDERGIVRWSRAYPGPVNPGVDGVLRALESMGPTADAASPQTGDRGKGVVRPWEE